MGCGASSTAAAPPAAIVVSQSKPEAGLPNGHIPAATALKGQSFKRTSNLKNNTVGPAPAFASPAPAESSISEEIHEITEVGEVLTVKRILKLSSIDEYAVDDQLRNAATQTNKQRRRKRVSNQATQTDLQLFPEDELEAMLMTDEEEETVDLCSHPENESDKLESSDDESPDKGFASESGKTDVATQSASWSCSKSTQTRLSFPAISARLRLASLPNKSNPSSYAPTRREGHDDRAKRSPYITTQASCSKVAKASVVSESRPTESVLWWGASSSAISPGNSLREASVQTDMHTNERRFTAERGPKSDTELHPRPPVSRKKDMIPSLSIFRDTDVRVHGTPDKEWESPAALAHHLCRDAPNELFSIRAIFVWIAFNIRYELRQKGKAMTPFDVILKREGVDSHYCCLFQEMCHSLGIGVKTIRGFVKGHEYRPGYQFIPDKDEMHEWNAVHVLGSWRLVDTSCGTGFTDSSGQFNRRLSEHYFLPDPEVLIWSHYPFSENSPQSSGWQLIDKPISLREFNALPRVTPQFFEYNMQIRSKQSHPYEFKVQAEIQIGAHEPMRYKYKLFPADQAENESLNHFAFCQLKENRLVGSFIVTPPLETRYFLKVYAKAERDMLLEGTDTSSLPAVATFLLICTRARKHVEPFPLTELPWGPTQAFYDFKMRILNQNGPVISTWGGKRKLVIETCELMLIQHQMLDADGMEMDVRTYILKEENGRKISFTIAPPHASKFKFLLFGMPKPKQQGHWRLPLLATFLVDCKLAKILPKDPDPAPVPFNSANDVNFPKRKASRASDRQ